MTDLEKLIADASHCYFLPESARITLEMVGRLLNEHDGDLKIIVRKSRLKSGQFRLSLEIITDPAE